MVTPRPSRLFGTEFFAGSGYRVCSCGHIWDGVDLYQRYWTAPLDAPTRLGPHRDGAIGCVWELELIAAEGERWAAVYDLEDAADRYLAPSAVAVWHTT